MPAEQRALLGISDNLIRLSIGIEHVDDLVEDLASALQAVLDSGAAKEVAEKP